MTVQAPGAGRFQVTVRGQGTLAGQTDLAAMGVPGDDRLNRLGGFARDAHTAREIVTGAGGKTGAAVLAALADAGARTVALVRSDGHATDRAHERVVGVTIDFLRQIRKALDS